MSKDIKLNSPVRIDGVDITKVRMREPKVKDQLAVDKVQGEAAKEITLFANLCELSPADIEEMVLSDYRQLQEAYQSFLPSTPETSGKPA